MFNDYTKVLQFFKKDIRRKDVLVFGDIMLDQYYFGDVTRISPEAPVPVLRVTEEKKSLGGAANVANNLASLGCLVELIGVVGDDENRKKLCHLLQSAGIKQNGVTVTSRSTTTKIRCNCGHQQMLRLDVEVVEPMESVVEEQIKRDIGLAFERGIGIAIISDYGKGACTPSLCNYLINICIDRNIKVIVDPKGLEWNKYSGASIITPNVKELGELFRINIDNEDNPIEHFADKIRRRYKIKNVIVTRSEKGLSLFRNNKPIHIPTYAQDVYDVSGAGDTVVAVLCAALMAGLDVRDSAAIANLAASVVVGKVGTYAINRAELESKILNYLQVIQPDAKCSFEAV